MKLLTFSISDAMTACNFLISFAECQRELRYDGSACKGEGSHYVFFDHVGLCIVKTFSMFVGELGNRLKVL